MPNNFIINSDIIPFNEIKILSVQAENADVNFVFEYQGLILRLIINSDKEEGRWANIQEFCKSWHFKKLMKHGLIPVHIKTGKKLEGFESGDVYIVQRVFIPGSWQLTPSQKIDCLIMMCKIQIALSDIDICLTDVHWGNVGFLWSRPVYIDIGSFSERSSILDMHLPLLLDEFGLTFDGDWERLLHDLYHVKVEIPKGEWSDYDNGAALAQSEMTYNWIKDLPHQKTLTDIGCSSGGFVKYFLEKGYGVIAVESDEYLIDKLYRETRGKQVFCLKAEINAGSINKPELFKSDIVLASSITHHLTRQGFTFNQQAELWEAICNRYLIVEFIDRTDIHVCQWKELDENYTKENFLNSFKDKWRILDEKSDSPNRYWYFIEKLNGANIEQD